MSNKSTNFKNSTKLKEAILKTAISIAKKEGWEAVSTRKVSRKINFSTTVIYHYFGNKNELLLELQKMGFEKLHDILDETVKMFPDDPEKQILEASISKWNFAKENKALYRLMFSLEGTGYKGRPAELVNSTGLSVMQVFNKILSRDQMSFFANWWALTHGFITIALTSCLGPDEEILFRYYKQAVNRLVNDIKIV